MCAGRKLVRRKQNSNQPTAQEQSTSLVVGSHTLEECEGVADAVRSSSSKLRRI